MTMDDERQRRFFFVQQARRLAASDLLHEPVERDEPRPIDRQIPKVLEFEFSDDAEPQSLDEICARHDRFMRELAVIHKVHEPPELPPAPLQPEPASELADHVIDAIGDGCAMIAKDVVRKERASMRIELRDDVEKALAPLRVEIAELRGQITALLTISRNDAGAANIVDLKAGWSRKVT